MHKYKARTAVYTGLVAGLLLLAGCSNASGGDPVGTTVPDDGVSTSTTILNEEGLTATTLGDAVSTTTTLGVVPTTTAPTTTTTTIPVADDAEVKIIRQQAHEVVSNFLDRAKAMGAANSIVLKESDPFGGPARRFLEFWADRREGIIASYDALLAKYDVGGTNALGYDTWIEGAEDKYQRLVTAVPAGNERIIPVGNGIYYVDGAYEAGLRAILGDVGGFHFKVENGQAVLLDMVIWHAGAGPIQIRERANTLWQGTWLSERELDSSQIQIDNMAGSTIDVTLKQAYADYMEGSTGRVFFTTEVTNTATDPMGVGTRGSERLAGDAAEDAIRLEAGFIEDGGEELLTGTMGIVRYVAVDGNSSQIMTGFWLLPVSVMLYGTTGTIELLKAAPGDTDPSVTAEVTFALPGPDFCDRVDASDTAEFTITTCTSPEEVYNR